MGLTVSIRNTSYCYFNLQLKQALICTTEDSKHTQVAERAPKSVENTKQNIILLFIICHTIFFKFKEGDLFCGNFGNALLSRALCRVRWLFFFSFSFVFKNYFYLLYSVENNSCFALVPLLVCDLCWAPFTALLITPKLLIVCSVFMG
jgi:hypothetical protein